jgi:peptidoglycan/xylan/chitin deacetylase (PgdA/CDA1 family)
VALTFHGAGDPALTAQVLRIVGTAQAAITVFAVGQWLAANPGIGSEISQAGHDLGNHTWSHQVMTRLSSSEATREVQRGADAVTTEVGSPGLLFRPSGTASSTPTILAAAISAGYHRCVSYDVDPADYTDPGSDAVRLRTLSAIQPGSIVSLHLGHLGTVTALPGILQGLADRHLTPVTMTRLLAEST